jgi:hypothetical protein
MERKGHVIRNVVSIGCAIVFYGLYRLSFLVPGLVEDVYSRGFFKFVNQILSSVTGILPFSLGEFMVYGFIVYVGVYLLYSLIALIFVPGRRIYNFLTRLLSLVAIAASLFTSFVVFWGFNYAREPLAKSMQLDVKPVSKEVLYEVSLSLVTKANLLREGLQQNKDGVFVSSYSRQQILDKVPEIYKDVAAKESLDFFGGNFGSPKPVLNSKAMSYAGLVGLYFPYTGESNVNTDIPVVTFLAGACHESAHQRGFAREDEANFIAYYVCRESGDKNFAYSGTILALLYAEEALDNTDPDLLRNVTAHYSAAVARDIDNYSRYWDSFKGPAEEAVEVMNNTYLKANMQHEGVKSYGRMVDLLIALYEKEKAAKPMASA